MYSFKHIPHLLNFKLEAGTSRGILKQKETHFIHLWNQDQPEVMGIGETGLFRGLSADDSPDFESLLLTYLKDNSQRNLAFDLEKLRQNPSISMAIEMAKLDLSNGGRQHYFMNDFKEGKSPIPINGLVWMGDKDFMRNQIIQKIEQGFDCIKMKVGAIDFRTECDLLSYIRKEFGDEIILRVDANGAFTKTDALEKLKRLSSYNLHSIEQPIAAGQWEAMAQLIEESPLDIALDEELIGVFDPMVKRSMLEVIKPHYIILKPSLLGGFTYAEEWINMADSLSIGWWITSALESNIGLNAIAQWTASLLYKGHQGLGTGSLFTNNIDSPLFVRNGYLHYDPSR